MDGATLWPKTPAESWRDEEICSEKQQVKQQVLGEVSTLGVTELLQSSPLLPPAG